jgi:superoxide dismutase, Cu-Zn family
MTLVRVLFAATLLCAPAVNALSLGDKVQTDIVNQQGVVIGHATVQRANRGVILRVNVTGLLEGKHGMHFHMQGSCDTKDGFKSASGHIMPDNAPHGYLHPAGPHAGNLPNLIVGKDGTAEVELYSQLVSLTASDTLPVLQDADGSALIIHANEDDHFTQPIGGSGDRVACAVIPAIAE